jgi:hypothetical protein
VRVLSNARLAFRALSAHKVRTALTTLSIVIGVPAVIGHLEGWPPEGRCDRRHRSWRRFPIARDSHRCGAPAVGKCPFPLLAHQHETSLEAFPKHVQEVT